MEGEGIQRNSQERGFKLYIFNMLQQLDGESKERFMYLRLNYMDRGKLHFIPTTVGRLCFPQNIIFFKKAIDKFEYIQRRVDKTMTKT